MNPRIVADPDRAVWQADFERALRVARQRGAVVEMTDESGGDPRLFIDEAVMSRLRMGRLDWSWPDYFRRLLRLGVARGWINGA